MTVIGCILAYAIVYASVAFVNWEWNPGAWSEMSRFVAALFGSFAAACWIGIRNDK